MTTTRPMLLADQENLRRLTRASARDLWNKKMQGKGWSGRDISLVMFDWPPGRRSAYYSQPPAYDSIAAKDDTVDEIAYLALQDELLRKAESFSARGRRVSQNPMTRSGTLSFAPVPIKSEDIQQAIQETMIRLHPGIVRQEQILRCAFVATLPHVLQQSIGTLTSSVHPEMPTPSNEYQRTGKNKRRARIDLGFGHPENCEQIVGVVELKALHVLKAESFHRQLAKCDSNPPGLMFEGLAGDFQKLLDPKLPTGAFRCSWAVAKYRAAETPDEIDRWVDQLLQRVEQRLGLTRTTVRVDLSTGWRQFVFQHGPILHLCWYWPLKDNRDQFESVWVKG